MVYEFAQLLKEIVDISSKHEVSPW